MPNYSMPGVAMTRRGSRILGACALVTATVVGLTWRGTLDDPDPARVRIQVRTEQIGEGVDAGTTVRMDGVRVGAIAAVTGIDQGRQLITLDLDRAETVSLTDTFTIDYAPDNLFGISALTLRRATGGTALREGAVIDLAGRHADRVTDVTMGRLLRALTETSTDVLTPTLTELITQFHRDLRAFTPLLEAIVTMSRTLAETQRYPVPYLLDQYSSFFGGLGVFASATFRLLNAIMNIEVFRNDRPAYDAFIAMIVDGVFPAIGTVGDAANAQLLGYADMLTPLLHAVAATVPDPRRSQAETAALIERLDRIFADTPDGPAVNVAVVLHGMPGLSAALLGQPGRGGHR
ncbi:MlaD family protein [Nocardia altamirensis]|uniref:MlaD family protein n=1 Tax=Nocardia altamirensis TaxID=472158 RepID=UPI0009FBF1FC|nr:MlaD family protein [Nocardia altamirensis]